MVRQAISERGEARQDWDITAEIAKESLPGEDVRSMMLLIPRGIMLTW